MDYQPNIDTLCNWCMHKESKEDNDFCSRGDLVRECAKFLRIDEPETHIILPLKGGEVWIEGEE